MKSHSDPAKYRSLSAPRPVEETNAAINAFFDLFYESITQVIVEETFLMAAKIVEIKFVSNLVVRKIHGKRRIGQMSLSRFS